MPIIPLLNQPTASYRDESHGKLDHRICVWGEIFASDSCPCHLFSDSGQHQCCTHALVFVTLSDHEGSKEHTVYLLHS